jgi:lactate dehydrogenase-like 2-hydroxyacid dehydrogenase
LRAIIPTGARPIPEAVSAAALRLRAVAVAAVGYNIVDVAGATRRGILVTNTSGVLTETTADMAGALMLAVALGLENLALTPHIGSASGATRLMMATRAAESCVAALEGHRPPNLVSPEAWRSP